MTATERIVLADGLHKLANLPYSRFITADEVGLAKIVESIAVEMLRVSGIERQVPTNKPTAGLGDWERRREAFREEVF